MSARPTDVHGTQRSVSDRTYRELYDNMPVMYFEMDARGVVLAVNTFGARQLGYVPEELVGRSVIDVFHEDDKPEVTAQFEKLVAEADSRLASWEFRKRRKDGSVLWVRETARSMHNAEGRVVVMVVCQDITDRKLAEERRGEAERLVRKLSMQLSEAQERERRRIAVHLHDDVGQTLTAASLRLAQLAPEDAGPSELHEVKELIQRAMQDTRSLTFELASPVLYELGLSEALRALCEEQTADGDTRFRYVVSDDGTAVPERLAVLLYRIASELVFNVRKHADAREARVSLRVRPGRVELTVEDDGRGFDPHAVRGETGAKGIGLFSIEQRVDLAGGRLEIRSGTGRGTRIDVGLDLGGPVSDEGPHPA